MPVKNSLHVLYQRFAYIPAWDHQRTCSTYSCNSFSFCNPLFLHHISKRFWFPSLSPRFLVLLHPLPYNECATIPK
nr:MAG TPA: hypothetical protein [Caudoviricetes sp.]